MLIWIDASAVEEHWSRIATDAAQNLAIAAHEGKHVVGGHRDTLERFARCPDLSGSAIAAWRSAKTRFDDLSALRRELSTWVEVVGANQCPVSGVPWRVGLHWFSDSSRTQASRLFSEAGDDHELYTFFGEAAAPRGCPIRLDPVSLGGCNAIRVWHQAADGSPALGIVDSERKHAADGLGSTAGGALTAESEISAPSIRVLEVLPVHEAENLLSAGLVGELFQVPSPEAGRAADVIAAGMVGAEHGFTDLKREIAINLLTRALEHLRGQSRQKQKQLLLEGRGAPDRDLPRLIAAWGAATERARS